MNNCKDIHERWKVKIWTYENINELRIDEYLWSLIQTP